MSSRIIIPRNLQFSTLYSLTRPVIDPRGLPASREYIFDFSRLYFIDGAGLTVLSNTLEWLHHNGVVVNFIGNESIGSEAIKYLDDCGFFNNHLGYCLRECASSRLTTLACAKISEDEAFSWLMQKLSPFLSNILDVPSGGLASIRSSVGEVFNNIKDHSTLNVGFAYVQHYPRNHDVRITISDFGRGIPNSMRQQFPALNDMQAILRATAEGVTAQSTPGNRGLGLDFLIRRVTACNGKVTILSYNGAVECVQGANGAVERRPRGGNGAYPGTLVDISLRTDCFIGDECEEEEFEW